MISPVEGISIALAITSAIAAYLSSRDRNTQKRYAAEQHFTAISKQLEHAKNRADQNNLALNSELEGLESAIQELRQDVRELKAMMTSCLRTGGTDSGFFGRR